MSLCNVSQINSYSLVKVNSVQELTLEVIGDIILVKKKS